jgi:hypothetical protein
MVFRQKRALRPLRLQHNFVFLLQLLFTEDHPLDHKCVEVQECAEVQAVCVATYASFDRLEMGSVYTRL